MVKLNIKFVIQNLLVIITNKMRLMNNNLHIGDNAMIKFVICYNKKTNKYKKFRKVQIKRKFNKLFNKN